MSVFQDTDELYLIMQELWNQIKADSDMAQKLLDTRLVVRFIYKEPEGWLTIDGSDGKELKISVGPCETKAVVEMSMKSDFAHNFWLGKENPAVALLQGKIVSRGPVNRALALLPVVRPAFAIYPRIVEEIKNSA